MHQIAHASGHPGTDIFSSSGKRHLKTSIYYPPSVIEQIGYWFMNLLSYGYYLADDIEIAFDTYDCLAVTIPANDWYSFFNWGTTKLSTLDFSSFSYTAKDDLFDVIHASFETASILGYLISDVFTGYFDWYQLPFLPQKLDAIWRLIASLYG